MLTRPTLIVILSVFLSFLKTYDLGYPSVMTGFSVHRKEPDRQALFS